MTDHVTHHYRVTKYDPSFRDKWGAYTRDEWTIVTEIGDVIGGHLVTEAEVVETINKYLYAFEAFANESNVTSLAVRVRWLGPEYQERWGHLRDGDRVPLTEAVDMVRDMLYAEDLIVYLENDDFYTHVGYDMYMWVGSHVDCVKATAETRRIGLFVEPGIESPDLGYRF
jgi:hypothetical protein